MCVCVYNFIQEQCVLEHFSELHSHESKCWHLLTLCTSSGTKRDFSIEMKKHNCGGEKKDLDPDQVLL